MFFIVIYIMQARELIHSCRKKICCGFHETTCHYTAKKYNASVGVPRNIWDKI